MISLLQILGYVLLSPVMLLDVVCHFVMSTFWGRNKGTSASNKNNLASVPRGPTTKTHGAPRSVTDQPLVESYHDHRTVYEMLQASVQDYGTSRVAMRSRRLVETKKLHETDRFPTKIFGDGFDDITYQQLGELTHHFGSGLRKLGMTPIPSSFDDDKSKAFDKLQGDFKMVIFESTCPTWTIALQGAFSQSMTVATCYATLGHEAVVSAVQETNAATLMVNWKDVSSFVARAKEMPSLKIIIASLNELGKSEFNAQKFNGDSKIKVVTSDQVVEMGKKDPIKSPTPPKVHL